MNWLETMLAVLLLVLSLASPGYALLACRLVRRWLHEDLEKGEIGLPAVTFLRPLKAGVPSLAAKLEMLVEPMRPGDQLVLGADEGAEEMAECERLRAAFPEREIVLVGCRTDEALNPKVSKLMQMTPHARHDHWILSDSEALLDGGWLEAFRREWSGSGADALTAGYRFVNLPTWPRRLDAAAALLGLWPGLAMVRRFGRATFTLGACTGLHRSDVEAVGGWAAFGNFLAEDNRLGTALAEAGRTIRLSRQVAALDADPLTWRDYWRHQRRVAVTYRVCDPAGFAGMILTNGFVASGLLVVLAPGGAWTGFCALLAVAIQGARWRWFRDLGSALRFPIPWLFPVMLAASAVEIVCWCAAWCDRRVWWAGRHWHVSRAGHLRPEKR